MGMLFMLAANVLPIVCVICGTILALKSKEGWGWMIFIAIFTSSVPRAIDKIPGLETHQPQTTGSVQPQSRP